MRAPCRDCEDRNETCHAICERYLTWAKERTEAREKDYKKRLPERYVHDLQIRLTRFRLRRKARGRRG